MFKDGKLPNAIQLKLLKRKDYKVLIVGHKDRLTRFKFNYLQLLAKEQEKRIEVVNLAEDEKEYLQEKFSWRFNKAIHIRKVSPSNIGKTVFGEI